MGTFNDTWVHVKSHPEAIKGKPVNAKPISAEPTNANPSLQMVSCRAAGYYEH